MTQSITTIYWNTWFHAQNGKRDNGQKLLQRLEDLIQEYNPDVFGLNEVLVSRSDGSSPVIDFLKSKGYFCHFALLSPIDNEWYIGNLFASKEKPLSIIDHAIGPDTPAKQRGYDNYTVKTIEATVKVSEVDVAIVVNHLCHLWPSNWVTHLIHRKNYEKVIANINNKNLIIGGDFNETKYMLPWLRLPKSFKRKTGTLLHPTWRLNGQKKYLAFANYDNIVYSSVGNLKLHTFKVLNRHPSDHSPLLATFTLHP